MPLSGLPVPRADLVRPAWIDRPRRSEPGGSVVVLCGCGRARVLDLRSRRSRLAAVAATTAAITLLASGAALLLVGAGAVVAAIAIGLEVATADEIAAIAKAGYCQRCTTTLDQVDPDQLGGRPDAVTNHQGEQR